MGATATQLPAAQQKPPQLCQAEPSSLDHPSLALLRCPCGCAKVSWSDTHTHTRPCDLTLLPGYRMTAAPLCPGAALGVLQGWHLPFRPLSSPRKHPALGQATLGQR